MRAVVMPEASLDQVSGGRSSSAGRRDRRHYEGYAYAVRRRRRGGETRQGGDGMTCCPTGRQRATRQVTVERSSTAKPHRYWGSASRPPPSRLRIPMGIEDSHHRLRIPIGIGDLRRARRHLRLRIRKGSEDPRRGRDRHQETAPQRPAPRSQPPPQREANPRRGIPADRCVDAAVGREVPVGL